MTRAELKENAKKSLKGKYGEAIKMMFVLFLIEFAIGFGLGLILGLFNINKDVLDIFSSIASLITTGLFGFGMLSFYVKIARNEDVTYKELFAKTNLIWLYLGISIIVSIFTALWSLLLIIPGIIATFAYSQALLVALDNPDLGVFESIKKSKELMNGHKMDYFVLELSFLGWIILGLFTLGIGYLWLIPYMTVTQVNFYNNLKALK